MRISLSKTCEIYQGSQFWPPFLIRACSRTAGHSAPGLLGSQAFGEQPGLRISGELSRAELTDVWKPVLSCPLWGQQCSLAAVQWGGLARGTQEHCFYCPAACAWGDLIAEFANLAER